MTAEDPPTRRLFIAVMLPTGVQERLARLVDALGAHRAILRPVRPEALHFTLRFLGESTAGEERRVAAACAAGAAEVNPFQIAAGGFGVFPHARRPRVVWLGLREGAAELAALRDRVEDELLRHKVIAAREPFTPHLTLARVRNDVTPAARAALGADVARLPNREQARCAVTAISLVHSALTPRGSSYTVLHNIPLAPGD